MNNRTVVGTRLLFCIALAFPGMSCGPDSTSPPPGGGTGQIVFWRYSDREGSAEIYVVNADGSNVTNLTNHPANDSFPAWSPDGTRIAFVSDRDENQEIYLMNADGSNQTRLTDSPYYDDWPVWSPNGTRIAFFNRQGLQVINADGSDLTLVTTRNVVPTPWGKPFTWSPDSTRIAFIFAGNQLYVADADGSGEVLLVDIPSRGLSGPSGYPAWSPDGTQIAVAGPDGPIYVVDVNSSAPPQLVTPDCGGGFLTWSPDSTQIAFHGRCRESGVGLYVMNRDGSQPIQLTDDSKVHSGFSGGGPLDWSPDGQWIVFASGIIFDDSENVDIYVVNINDLELYQLTEDPAEDPAADLLPTWQP
jgi:TolB protein